MHMGVCICMREEKRKKERKKHNNHIKQAEQISKHSLLKSLVNLDVLQHVTS